MEEDQRKIFARIFSPRSVAISWDFPDLQRVGGAIFFA